MLAREVIVDPGDHATLLRWNPIITAPDGYRVVLLNGALNPNFGDVSMPSARERHGRKFSGENARVAVVALSDTPGGRYVCGSMPIKLRDIENASEVESRRSHGSRVLTSHDAADSLSLV